MPDIDGLPSLMELCAWNLVHGEAVRMPVMQATGVAAAKAHV